MPIYDVKCVECEEMEEVILKMEEEVPICKCGGKREKQMGASKFIINGYAAWNNYSDKYILEDSIPDNLGNGC